MAENKQLTPATWDNVLAVAVKAGPRGVTNRQIADILGSDYTDVSQLTRLLCRANLLDFRRDQLANIYFQRQPGARA